MNPFQGTSFRSSQPQLGEAFQDSQEDTAEAQRARNDSLVAIFANTEDPFQRDLVLHLLDYTSRVVGEVEGRLRQSRVPQSIIEKIQTEVSLNREPQFRAHWPATDFHQVSLLCKI